MLRFLISPRQAFFSMKLHTSVFKCLTNAATLSKRETQRNKPCYGCRVSGKSSQALWNTAPNYCMERQRPCRSPDVPAPHALTDPIHSLRTLYGLYRCRWAPGTSNLFLSPQRIYFLVTLYSHSLSVQQTCRKVTQSYTTETFFLPYWFVVSKLMQGLTDAGIAFFILGQLGI